MNTLPAAFHSKKDLRLNIGSGQKRREGFVNVDLLALPGVDIVCNLETALPFEDNSVAEVYGEHILEHIDHFIPLMSELYRVCKDGAVLNFRIPYLTSESSFKDPTHKRFICERTFSYFSRTTQDAENLPEYGLPMDFEILGYDYMYHRRIFALPILRTLLKRYCWNIVKTMVVSLRVVKPARVRRPKAAL